MKKIKISKRMLAVAAMCIFIATVVNGQTPAVSTTPPPPVNGNMPAPPSPPPGQQALQQVTTYKGTVVKLSVNDDYVYDGFYMLSSGDSLLVKFPPHLGTQITGAVKTGSTVTVNGVMNVAPVGEKEVRMVSVDAGSKTIADTGVAVVTPLTETYTSGSGKITQLQTDREGIVTGLIVDGKTILRIPPHVASQLNNVAQTNASIAYTGIKKAGNNGEISTKDFAIIHCKTITLNGQQYLVQ